MLDFLAARKERLEEGPGAAETRAWLSTLSSADSMSAARALVDRLVSLNRAQLQMRLRLRLLDMFSEHAEKLLPDLQQRIEEALPPVRGSTRQNAYLIEKLYKELAVGYSIVVLRAPRTWLSPGFRRQMHAPLMQAMTYHARRLGLSEKLYAPAPRGVWQALHQLYRLAVEWKMAERSIGVKDVSALRIYLEALLLSFAQPQQLGPGDFKRVQSYVKEHVHLAKFAYDQDIADSSNLFLIDTRGDGPGAAYAKRKSASQGRLLLDTGKLIERIRTELRQLRSLNDAMPRGGQIESGRVELLQRLEESWRGEHLQRNPRVRFHPRAQLWSGLANIWRLMRETARTPAHSSASMAGEWLIVNESPRGFALTYMSGAAPQLSVGEIVALRGNGRSKLHVCVVRWIVSNGPEHLEVGLQQLAPLAIPAWYQAPEGERATTESVLYLPSIPGPQKSALLIAPTGRIDMARTVEILHAQGRLSLYATRVTETTSSAEFIEVVPA
ncbi:MAG TPA: hypothetical protein VJU83_05725 [Burkholderiales bacterium]|nr:hypothetical protein [Burkholderiales bacterium]